MDDFEVSQAELARIANRAGIDAIGATTAEPFDALLPHLRKYYEEGRSSGFEHQIPEERIDPKRLLPSAKSLISIAVSYVTKDTMALKRHMAGRGIVSVYAWGEDYHAVLKRKLELVKEELEQVVGRPIEAVSCIDTAPLVDRAVAERAGVGWIGKNCAIITQTHGSWVFLGTLITDVLIEGTTADRVAWDECGDCDLCLQACPTGALLEPRVIDSQRCLSYITQSKGIIDEEFRAPMGRRVWGCDTCQTVCPKNKVSLLGVEGSFTPMPELTYPDLIRILTMSRRAFMREFGQTAAAWRGVNVWKRNALIALGNMRSIEAVPSILSMLEEQRSEIRASAAWALGRIDPDGTRAMVRLAYERETDQEARRDMAWAAEAKE